MGFVAHSPPNFAAAQKSLGVPPGPVMTQVKGSLPLSSQVNGIMNMVSQLLICEAMSVPEYK